MQQAKPAEIKALTILHLALLIGQAMFLLIAAALVYIGKVSSSSSLKSYPHEILLLCIGIGFAAYLIGKFLFKKKMEQINAGSKSLSEKFNDYRAACILKWALIEFATLICIILFFATGIDQLLIVAGALILLFITTRPSLSKAASDLNVSETELNK